MEEFYGVEEVKKVLLLLVLFACTPSPSVHFDDTMFTVEIAETSEERSKGLMFRESMREDHGMLFIFDEVAPRSFWMKNTLISLDMIFLDDTLVVVDIKQNVPPCEADPCPAYSSSLPAMYVLELNAGIAEKEGIVLGSRMLRK